MSFFNNFRKLTKLKYLIIILIIKNTINLNITFIKNYYIIY